jgi:hypothetical protein
MFVKKDLVREFPTGKSLYAVEFRVKVTARRLATLTGGLRKNKLFY